MKSTEIINDIHKFKNEVSTKNAQLQETITEYRDVLVAEGVQEIQKALEEGPLTDRELRLIIGDVVRKCIQV